MVKVGFNFLFILQKSEINYFYNRSFRNDTKLVKTKSLKDQIN